MLRFFNWKRFRKKTPNKIIKKREREKSCAKKRKQIYTPHSGGGQGLRSAKRLHLFCRKVLGILRIERLAGRQKSNEVLARCVRDVAGKAERRK